MDLLKWAENYWPYDEAEEADRQSFLQLLEMRKKNSVSLYKRECLPAHITVSCWIVNAKRNHTLLGFHNLYKHWGWFGGHADGERMRAAIHEIVGGRADRFLYFRCGSAL